jgi:hypothetical protein
MTRIQRACAAALLVACVMLTGCASEPSQRIQYSCYDGKVYDSKSECVHKCPVSLAHFVGVCLAKASGPAPRPSLLEALRSVFCMSCFLEGLGRGLVGGVLAAALLGAIAAVSPLLAAVVGVTMLGASMVAAASTLAGWGEMSAAARSMFFGELVGAGVAGAFGRSIFNGSRQLVTQAIRATELPRLDLPAIRPSRVDRMHERTPVHDAAAEKLAAELRKLGHEAEYAGGQTIKDATGKTIKGTEGTATSRKPDVVVNTDEGTANTGIEVKASDNPRTLRKGADQIANERSFEGDGYWNGTRWTAGEGPGVVSAPDGPLDILPANTSRN